MGIHYIMSEKNLMCNLCDLLNRLVTYVCRLTQISEIS